MSWFEAVPITSLRMLKHAGNDAGRSVVDVGGGTSRLVDCLLDQGHSELAVLDLSPVALDATRARLGPRGAKVRWVTGNVTGWQPERQFDIWHDRAVLHFLPTPDGQERYAHVLDAATHPGSHAVIGTFGLGGPQQCSGLPVTRYDPHDLARLFGDHWRLIHADQDDHVTPAGVTQAFTWTVFRRRLAIPARHVWGRPAPDVCRRFRRGQVNR